MADLGQRKPSQANFVERKYLKILKRPLQFSGTLSYTPPNRLEKQTLFPRPESLVVDGDKLTIENPRQRRVLALQEYPVVWAFVESIRATLKGDAKSLTRFYRLDLAGNSDQWQLTLSPLEEKMRAMIRQIQIAGSKNRVQSIEIHETDGDRSVMTVTEDAP